MGLYKKAYGCKSGQGRVRQKPLDLTQLDLFSDLDKEFFNVRTQKKGPLYGPLSFEEIIFGRSPMDSPDECSS